MVRLWLASWFDTLETILVYLVSKASEMFKYFFTENSSPAFSAAVWREARSKRDRLRSNFLGDETTRADKLGFPEQKADSAHPRKNSGSARSKRRLQNDRSEIGVTSSFCNTKTLGAYGVRYHFVIYG